MDLVTNAEADAALLTLQNHLQQQQPGVYDSRVVMLAQQLDRELHTSRSQNLVQTSMVQYMTE